MYIAYNVYSYCNFLLKSGISVNVTSARYLYCCRASVFMSFIIKKHNT